MSAKFKTNPTQEKRLNQRATKDSDDLEEINT
jgi:hypothetical protein